MSNNFAPLVNVKPTDLEISEKRLLSSLIDVQDLDNNPILKYRFRDNGTLATSGFFTRNGVKVAANQWIEVSAAELANVYYNSGLIIGQETISVMAYDGRWSNVATGAMFTIKANFFAPEIATQPGFILANEVRMINDLFTATDRDGDAIKQFRFLDTQAHPHSGYLTFNGAQVPAGQWFTIEANQLNSIRYVSAAYGTSTETIRIQASDGKSWGTAADLVMTTTPNNFAPILNARDVQAAAGRDVSVRSFFTVSDPDGNSIKEIWFRDTGVDASSGFFTVNGVPKQQGVYFSVPYSQLDSVRYQYASLGEVEFFDVRVSDGKFTTPATRGQITSVPRPVIEVVDNNVIMDAIQFRPLLSMFDKVDTGPLYTKYEVYGHNPNFESARIVVNGNPLLQNRIYELSATQMANAQVRSAVSDPGRSLDEIYVRGFNGIFWTDWQRINIRTEPVNIAALQSFGRWDNQVNGKTQVTFSFADTPPPYYAPDDENLAGFQPMTVEARAAIRAIYKNIETFADLRFVELPWWQNGPSAKTVWAKNDQTDSQGYTIGPIQESGQNDPIGDIWINNSGVTGADDPFRGTPGGYAWLTYYHEIGHSMGFKHPFDGSPVLPPWIDSHQLSIMSYNSSFDAPPASVYEGHPITFMMYDIMELQRLYRPNMSHNADNTQYRWSIDDTDLRVIWDAGGIDTLNYGNQFAPAVIDLREGRYSSLNGRANAMGIAFGAVIENARGTHNNDVITGNDVRNTLWGGNGNDRLIGLGGNDVLRGGAGNDTYVWGPGDGRDIIREAGDGGRDTIEIVDRFNRFNSLEVDFTFWKAGQNLRDLRMEITLGDRQSIGGITVADMINTGSQVEILRVVDRNGEQLGRAVDLTSVWVGATDQKQNFRITDFQTQFGFVAVPV